MYVCICVYKIHVCIYVYISAVQERLKETGIKPGAVWHIFGHLDADTHAYIYVCFWHIYYFI